MHHKVAKILESEDLSLWQKFNSIFPKELRLIQFYQQYQIHVAPAANYKVVNFEKHFKRNTLKNQNS